MVRGKANNKPIQEKLGKVVILNIIFVLKSILYGFMD